MNAAEKFFHRGNDALKRGNRRKAISLYNRSLKLSPDNEFVLMNKAGSLMDLHIYDEALETIEKAIDVAPNIAKCWGMKGDIMEAQGKYYEALRCFDRAIELDPDDDRLYKYRAGLALRAILHNNRS